MYLVPEWKLPQCLESRQQRVLRSELESSLVGWLGSVVVLGMLMQYYRLGFLNLPIQHISYKLQAWVSIHHQ